MTNQVYVFTMGGKEVHEIESDIEATIPTYVGMVNHRGINLISISQDTDDIRLTKAEVEALITVLTELKETM